MGLLGWMVGEGLSSYGGILCCRSVGRALLMMSCGTLLLFSVKLYERVVVPFMYSERGADQLVTLLLGIFRYGMVLATSFLGILVSSVGAAKKTSGSSRSPTLSRVSGVQYAWQRFSFFLYLTVEPIFIALFYVATIFQPHLYPLRSSLLLSFVGFYLFFVIWFHFMCRISRSFWLIVKAGGSGWEGLTPQEIAAQGENKHADLNADNTEGGDDKDEDCDVESEVSLPLLPPNTTRTIRTDCDDLGVVEADSGTYDPPITG